MVDGSEPTKAERRAAAREAARLIREAEKRRVRRMRILAIVASSLAVIVVLGAVAFVVLQSRRTGAQYANVAYGGADVAASAPAPGAVTAPVANATSGILVNNLGLGVDRSSDVHVDLYFDFQCPYCQKFEAANGQALANLIAGGGVTLVYHPLAFLDRYSANTLYSTRAANAAAVVAQGASDRFLPFVAALFSHQPEENTPGLSDAEIAQIAADAGVPQEVASSFTNTVTGTYVDGKGNQHQGTWRTFAPWVFMLTQKAESDFGNQFGTPTVLVNGQRFTGDLYSDGPLEAAIVAAKG